MAKSSTKKRKVIVDAIGEAHIAASFNNIIISIIAVCTLPVILPIGTIPVLH